MTVVDQFSALRRLSPSTRSGPSIAKSMTTYQDRRVWQDVYHVPTPMGVAYVKFTLRSDGAIVISFKRL